MNSSNNKSVFNVEDLEREVTEAIPELARPRRVRSLGSGAEARSLFGRDFDAPHEEAVSREVALPPPALPQEAPSIELSKPIQKRISNEFVRSAVFMMALMVTVASIAYFTAAFEKSLSTHVNNGVRSSLRPER